MRRFDTHAHDTLENMWFVFRIDLTMVSVDGLLLFFWVSILHKLKKMSCGKKVTNIKKKSLKFFPYNRPETMHIKDCHDCTCPPRRRSFQQKNYMGQNCTKYRTIIWPIDVLFVAWVVNGIWDLCCKFGSCGCYSFRDPDTFSREIKKKECKY